MAIYEEKKQNVYDRIFVILLYSTISSRNENKEIWELSAQKRQSSIFEFSIRSSY